MSITPLLKAEEAGSEEARNGEPDSFLASWSPASLGAAAVWTNDPPPDAIISRSQFWMFNPADPQEPTPEEMEALIAYLLTFPQVEMPVTHHFAPGIYVREIFMPADTFVIGHRHKTEHLNIIREGRVQVWMRGVTEEKRAHTVFKSGVDVQKVLYIHEDTYWATVHNIADLAVPLTDEGTIAPDDLRALEDRLIHRSPASIRHTLKGTPL